ncbi:MAG: lipopolysaccharide heptosyltransferase II [Candidatus Eisenbacteria bacterium]|uniref:lipopolysaccharide heptosyltransferase II n=1 Tax=Eiseniibacteriota bacterium TaxID=2212470 RepID=A0A9D6L795_UNCEI|nr:lipopolysaccharide heptosyltransferase II [Candidatus Eisenbacteria bacterium]MBI3540223.1 lipopolysaccharide heptosyltransferase II [Candidatus Eisenbacteria bacterium]
MSAEHAALRILIRLPNWLGDALMARPLLHALRAAHPDAEVRALGPAPLLELLAAERTFDRGEPWPGDGRERGALARALRAWRPDAALILPFSFSSARFALAAGASRRIGYAHEARSFMLTEALRRPPRGELHLSREYLALGARLGAREVALPKLAVRAEAHDAARALVGEAAAGRGVAVIAPRSAYGPARQWPAERFAALARALIAGGRTVLVAGTGAEADTCAAVADAAGEGARSIAGRTTLPVLAALVAAADVAVCNDSGLAHLAGAVGTPTVTLYGSTSSAWTTALGPRVRIIQHPPVCSPCFRRTCAIGYRCLTAIDVAEVAGACRAMTR